MASLKDALSSVSYAYTTSNNLPPFENPDMVAYIINDKFITGYSNYSNNNDGSAGYEFYGDTNGEEFHFITSNGHVFTLPGFALTQEDGTIPFYISNEKGAYYTTIGNSDLDVGDYNVNGDRVDEEKPITAWDLADVFGLESTNEPTYYVYPNDDVMNRNTTIGGWVS